jgi:hypothetical protein
MTVLFEKMPGSKEDNTANSPETKFWFKWRIYYLIPIPFMALAILIFLKFANKETIKFLVTDG